SSPALPDVCMPLLSPLGVQFSSQPSSLMVLPSSHCSPAVLTPLPQAVFVQLLSQPSPLMALPSSHSSVPWLTSPSPHCATTQFLVAWPVTVPVRGLPASTMRWNCPLLNSSPAGTWNETLATMESTPAVPEPLV